jgi:flagellar motility protein MotE (MotC chaperone)
MKRILNIGRTVFAILFLATAAGAGVLFGVGMLKAEKIKAMFAAPPAEKSAVQAAKPAPLSNIDGIARRNIELNKELEQRRANEPISASIQETLLLALKGEVESRRAALDKARATFDADRTAFEKSKKEFETKVSDEGFKKNLEVLEKMDPKDTAKTIYAWRDEEILRYFRQMKTAVLTQVIAELNKYPAKATEGQRGAELLNKLDEFTFGAGAPTVGKQ